HLAARAGHAVCTWWHDRIFYQSLHATDPRGSERHYAQGLRVAFAYPMSCPFHVRKTEATRMSRTGTFGGGTIQDTSISTQIDGIHRDECPAGAYLSPRTEASPPAHRVELRNRLAGSLSRRPRHFRNRPPIPPADLPSACT